MAERRQRSEKRRLTQHIFFPSFYSCWPIQLFNHSVIPSVNHSDTDVSRALVLPERTQAQSQCQASWHVERNHLSLWAYGPKLCEKLLKHLNHTPNTSRECTWLLRAYRDRMFFPRFLNFKSCWMTPWIILIAPMYEIDAHNSFSLGLTRGSERSLENLFGTTGMAISRFFDA